MSKELEAYKAAVKKERDIKAAYVATLSAVQIVSSKLLVAEHARRLAQKALVGKE